ncbi:hypothetical protein CDL15_Pgr007748 [Punica granatum]|uniref:Laccase n=1 Tax=Punica granatum TaxID=22663 RepID=A0A218XAH5_PUNGR|nr:hypothetical protein CDL15_Pgr007748 [Punica granatum]
MEFCRWVHILVLVIACFSPAIVECKVRKYTFSVVMKSTTRSCSSKPIVTLNGQFPGPTLYAREGDNVLVKVVNRVKYNVSIHWHGIRQLRTGWADGPAYITQCPIQAGQSYVYNFTITGQRGTLLWHAHILWPKATVHGAIQVLPKRGVPYPFPEPHTEVIVRLGGFTLPVENGKTYMLRILNAALSEELFFKMAGHKLTAVEVDATYMKPFKIDTIVIAPGQTTNVLVRADKSSGKYLTTLTIPPPKNATAVANKFINSLRSLNSKKYPARVPKNVDYSLFFTVGLGIHPCSTCKAGNGSRVVADINNVTFVMPTTSLLQAHFFNISRVFTTDFPANPPFQFNYTGTSLSNLRTTRGTKVYRLRFNFFAAGKGLGNYNPNKDPKKLNLVDPVERSTISVPSGGWVAIRFRADNPGVSFMHCHLEVHTTWGLKMAFLVDNGKGPNESLLQPPSDLPKC